MRAASTTSASSWTASTWRQVLVIVVLSVLAAALSVAVHPKRPPWYRVASAEELRWRITPEEVARLVDEGPVLWVDSRSREKFEEGHRPGAILLNLEEWGDLMFEHMDTLQDAMTHPVVVYCDGTDCRKSLAVAGQLRELLGLEPVYVLHGDWRAIDQDPKTPAQ